MGTIPLPPPHSYPDHSPGFMSRQAGTFPGSGAPIAMGVQADSSLYPFISHFKTSNSFCCQHTISAFGKFIKSDLNLVLFCHLCWPKSAGIFAASTERNTFDFPVIYMADSQKKRGITLIQHNKCGCIHNQRLLKHNPQKPSGQFHFLLCF